MSYTLPQQMALSIVPKFTGLIGICCSVFMMTELVRDHRKGEGNPIKRVLFAVATYELLDAFGWFLSGWAVPADFDFALAAGTQGTCSFQGFILQSAIGGPLSYAAVTYFFYLVVRHGYNMEQLEKFEWKLLRSIAFFTFGSAVLPLFLNLYNPVGQTCWIVGFPAGCHDSVFGGSDYSCERGDHAYLYGLFLFYGILWISILLVIFLNISMRNTLIEVGSGDSSWITTQTLLYGLAFLITWTPSTIWSVMSWTSAGSLWFDLPAAIFEPIGGLWTMLIFIRNRPDSVIRLKGLLGCHLIDPDSEITIDDAIRESSIGDGVVKRNSETAESSNADTCAKSP